MKHGKSFYLSRTIAHLDNIDLAALYVESQINDFDEWFRAMLAEELVRRPTGLESLLTVEVCLYGQGMVEAYWPLHVAVLINFDNRGELTDVIRTLAEKGNLENAIKVVGANCDWLPEEELNDENVDMVARVLKTIVGIR